MSVKVTGLDLSMTATGACRTTEDGAQWRVIKPKKLKDHRLGEIKAEIREIVRGSGLVLIEMLPPNMKAAGITGMVQGVVRDMLLEERIPYGDVGPSSLKKYATGKGGASKTEMALAALNRGGVTIPDDNACDAWWLWVMAQDYLEHPLFSLPKINRDMLGTIEMKG